MNHKPIKPALIILAAGGTGGHIFPAEAVARILQEKGYRLAFFTDHRQYPNEGVLSSLPTRRLWVTAIAGKGRLRTLLSLIRLLIATLQAMGSLLKHRPKLVVGFGGYASVPTILAAKLLRIRYAIHEQNAILGKANRLVAAGASLIALGFPRAEKIPPKARKIVVWTGNPIRSAIADHAPSPYAPPKNNEKLHVLVTGGSQGASIFSNIIPATLAMMEEEDRARIHLTQQVRPEDLDRVQKTMTMIKVEAELQPFFTDMGKQISKAHLVISRAGAGILSELLAIGRPSILVPYPHAVDDHQAANASRITEAAAAWTIDQSEFTSKWLAERLSNYLNQPEILNLAAKATQTLAKPNAAIRLAEQIETLLKQN